MIVFKGDGRLWNPTSPPQHHLQNGNRIQRLLLTKERPLVLITVIVITARCAIAGSFLAMQLVSHAGTEH